MTSSKTNNSRRRGSWIKILLFPFALLLLTAVPAHAQSANCVGPYGGILDGNVQPTGPSTLLIDGACTIKNYPASNPYLWNISWSGINDTLLIFDNVIFNGNMSCDSHEHGDFVWFVNGSLTRAHILKCANLFVPVDKIDKQNPPGPPFVSIGVPFTYTLTFPQLVSATTGVVIDPNGSNLEVDQVTVTDDLNASGVSLSYVKSSAAWKSSGAPVLFTVTNASGLLTFSGFPAIPPGQQIVLSVTVVLNNAVPPNSPGTQFSNTANWTLGTTIGGIFHYPLPGQQGVSSPPLTIAAPDLVMTKGGPATMNPGQLGQFTLNVQNTGHSDAWNATVVDKLPTGATGGMCTATPQILSARVFQADGVTPVPGKGPLTLGTDYTLNYAGAPACTLTLNMLSAAAVIGPTQRLIVTYQTQLDANTQNGATLTNVAGTTLWYDGASSSTRQSYTCTLTNGTPGVLDCQDAHTVTALNPALTITKQVSVVGGGAAMPGGQLDYLLHVTNVSTNPVTPVMITDDLSTAGAGRLTFVNGTATMNGSTSGVSIAGSLLTANYSAVYGPLQPGQSIDLRFRANIASGLPAGTTLTNTGVVTWNTPPQTASASVSIDVGGVPGSGSLNGTVWLDANFNKNADLNEPRLQGWKVGLYRNGVLVQSVVTDASGVYRFTGVPPTDTTPERYELQFQAPGAGPNTAKLGKADSVFTNFLQRITNIAVPSGSNLQNLNLPIGPNGVVYNSMTRAPIAGVTLNLLRASSRALLPTTCFDDPAQQGQITQAGGYYRFDINFSDPACPAGGSYLIEVTAPTSIYVAGESKLIPATSDAATAPFSVPTCAGSVYDALPAIPYCEAQASSFAPPASLPAGSGTRYYLNLILDGTAVPGSSQIYNNHIPLDPQLSGVFSITKTTPLRYVTRGQLVPYTITINNVLGASVQGVQIVDSFPAGFRYVPGSARLDGGPAEPTLAGRQLVWKNLSFGASDHRTIVLLLAVGAGVGEGEFVNRAQVIEGATGRPLSGQATATVRVVPDQTFDCTDVFGKVFDDVNRNGRQDPGEKGLPGVRVVTTQGLEAVTDPYGRFHITCAVTPDEDRGSNFVLKLDDRTLPSGYRMSTDQLQIKRATRGKALKFDFGASIYRVVAIDLSDEAFEPGKTEIRAQWRPRLNLLLQELHKAPSVLRLSYVAETEDAALVERRVQAVKQQVSEAWDAGKDSYVLTIEPEVFWRLGAPPKRLNVHLPESR